eukprot:Em0016g795a
MQEKFNNATVNNMDSERAVVSVNYGLKIRGAQEIKAFSSSLVKAKVVDYMDGRKKKQGDLKKSVMDDKEISNITAHDKQRNSDLAILTGQGGLFTKPEQVEEFL